MQIFNWDNASIRNEPFTVFYIRDLVEPKLYDELADSFPDLSLFRYRDTLGNKYLLTEAEGQTYFDFVNARPQWRRFYEEIKGQNFINQVLHFLRSHMNGHASASRFSECLTSRFEFSALPTTGGSQRPHTDSPQKVVTLVLSLMKVGEWDPNWGGGTSICLPKDQLLRSNYSNRYLEFDDVDVIDTLPFTTNGCVMFVKSDISWHCVMPINLSDGRTIRKTVAISLFNKDAN
jgi:hypothetical protein